MPININPRIKSKIVFPICDPAINHLRFNFSTKRGVSRLDINIEEAIVNGTNDAPIAEPVNIKIVLITLTIYNTSPILASDWPNSNKEKFLFNFIINPPIFHSNFGILGDIRLDYSLKFDSYHITDKSGGYRFITSFVSSINIYMNYSIIHTQNT